jgi:hypothetical protein
MNQNTKKAIAQKVVSLIASAVSYSVTSYRYPRAAALCFS